MNYVKATVNHYSDNDPNAKLSDYQLLLIHEYFNEYTTKGNEAGKNSKPTILKFYPSNGKEPDHKNHG